VKGQQTVESIVIGVNEIKRAKDNAQRMKEISEQLIDGEVRFHRLLT
jgi:hypothetical protein